MLIETLDNTVSRGTEDSKQHRYPKLVNFTLKVTLYSTETSKQLSLGYLHSSHSCPVFPAIVHFPSFQCSNERF